MQLGLVLSSAWSCSHQNKIFPHWIILQKNSWVTTESFDLRPYFSGCVGISTHIIPTGRWTMNHGTRSPSLRSCNSTVHNETNFFLVSPTFNDNTTFRNTKKKTTSKTSDKNNNDNNNTNNATNIVINIHDVEPAAFLFDYSMASLNVVLRCFTIEVSTCAVKPMLECWNLYLSNFENYRIAMAPRKVTTTLVWRWFSEWLED